MVTSGIETKVLCLGDVVSSDLLGDLAERGCFSIPAIQRQYQWGPGDTDSDAKNRSAREFLDDTILFHRLAGKKGNPYFIGTMILYREKNTPDGHYQLMDGQQRWTTITSLMGVIYHLLDQDSTAVWTREKNEIKRRFLLNDKGDSLLSSDREFDDYVIKKICRFEGQIDISDIDPRKMSGASNIPEQKYKTELGHLEGTHLFCVSRYFKMKLQEEFWVKGPLDSRDKLVSYYRCLRSQLFLNLTLAPSAAVAYKMFVTANARGTALTNFDIFRGLVLAKELESEMGKSKHYKDAFDQATIELNKYISNFKDTDAAKKTDQMMARATGILLGKRVENTSVMAVLQEIIDGSDTHDTLNAICNFIFQYLHYSVLLVEKKVSLPGRRVHRRLEYTGFSGFIPIYIAALMKWKLPAGKGVNYQTDEIHHLLRIVECFIFRIWLHNGAARRATLAMWGVGYEVAKEVYFSKQSKVKVLKSVSEKFSAHQDNPDSLSDLKTREWGWSPTKAGNYMLGSVMYALEETNSSPARSGKGSGNVWKITPLMPPKDMDWWNTRHWDYGPEKGVNPQPRSKTIGNMFALTPPRNHINGFSWYSAVRAQSFRNATAGQTVTNAIPASNQWDHDYIDDRNDKLIVLLETRFPQSCWLPGIDTSNYSSGI